RVVDALARFDQSTGEGAVEGPVEEDAPGLEALGLSSRAFALNASSAPLPASNALPAPSAPGAAAAPGAPVARPGSEGDLIAFEGDLLYLLRGDLLHLVDVGAAPEVVLRASLPVEGRGRQLLLRDGVAFVFSTMSTI